MKKITLALVIMLGLSSHSYGETPHTYEGSSFREVLEMLTQQNPNLKTTQEAEEFKVYQRGLIPYYPVNSQTVFGTKVTLVKDAQRTVNERYDYYDYLPKKLHANGVCVVGEWEINKPSPYSGYFMLGSKGLFIGRISVTMGHVVRGEKRGFGFAGKIFPTMNENEVVKTANFFAVDVLLGTSTGMALETKMTNQPDTGFDLSLLGLGLKISSALKQADQDPSFRPLTPIARLGETTGPIITPHWFRLSAATNTIKNSQSDFRNEILSALQENKEVSFNVDVSDTTSDRDANSWNNIGKIRLTRALVSYGCDRQLHFAHPKLNE